ncbi:MAG: ABC transporter permease, partial [Deltaproteobacteria bacterium]|nr:ABC transporter permease [Deltaproteobacteria bacterium]
MSYWQQVWKQFKKNRMAFAGLVIVCAIFLAAIFAPYIAPYSPTAYNLDSILASPGSTHLLGTDEQGRDVFSRIVYGARISLSVGFVAVSIYVLIGIVLGALAGFYGGWIDIVISRLIEIMLCFPTFFLILAVLAFVGPNIYNIMIVIGLTGWTGIARLVRAEFLKIKTLDYVLAAEAFGASEFRIILRHILPNALSPVLVSAAF